MKKKVLLLFVTLTALFTCIFGLTACGHEHSYTIIRVVQPTCIEKGFTLKTCDCGDVIIDNYVDALGHDWLEATCELPKTCSKCQLTKGTKLNHSFTNYVSNDDATYESDETKTAICDTEGCNATDTIFNEGTNLASLIFTFNNYYVNGLPKYGINGLTEYGKTLTEIVIPKKINDIDITTIGNSVFRDCSSLTSIEIPDSVTFISSDAFYNCSIEKAICPATAISCIAKSNVKEVIITSGESIGDNAFSGCTSLTSVTIPDSVTNIGRCAFSGCTSLTSVTIPDSVTSIGSSAFSGCSKLTSATIGNDVTSIEDYTFSNCFKLTSVTIGNKVTNIGFAAFNRCTSLSSITVGNSVTSIDKYAFWGCSSLTSIEISDSVTNIGYNVFCGCTSLTNIVVVEENANYKDVDGNLYTKDGSILIQYAIGKQDSSFNIPNSVTSIGDSAFYNCTSLTNVVISDGVTIIDDYAFKGCTSLTNIEIPASVTSIGVMAFVDCYKLTSIKFTGTIDEWSNITKGEWWNYSISGINVICSDGEVSI